MRVPCLWKSTSPWSHRAPPQRPDSSDSPTHRIMADYSVALLATTAVLGALLPLAVIISVTYVPTKKFPFFFLLECGFLLLILLAVVPLAFPATPAACTLFVWAFQLGYGLSLSNLAIYLASFLLKVSSRSEVRPPGRVDIADGTLLKGNLLVLAFNCGYLGLWQRYDPPGVSGAFCQISPHGGFLTIALFMGACLVVGSLSLAARVQYMGLIQMDNSGEAQGVCLSIYVAFCLVVPLAAIGPFVSTFALVILFAVFIFLYVTLLLASMIGTRLMAARLKKINPRVSVRNEASTDAFETVRLSNESNHQEGEQGTPRITPSEVCLVPLEEYPSPRLGGDTGTGMRTLSLTAFPSAEQQAVAPSVPSLVESPSENSLDVLPLPSPPSLEKVSPSSSSTSPLIMPQAAPNSNLPSPLASAKPSPALKGVAVLPSPLISPMSSSCSSPSPLISPEANIRVLKPNKPKVLKPNKPKSASCSNLLSTTQSTGSMEWLPSNGSSPKSHTDSLKMPSRSLKPRASAGPLPQSGARSLPETPKHNSRGMKPGPVSRLLLSTGHPVMNTSSPQVLYYTIPGGAHSGSNSNSSSASSTPSPLWFNRRISKQANRLHRSPMHSNLPRDVVGSDRPSIRTRLPRKANSVATEVRSTDSPNAAVQNLDDSPWLIRGSWKEDSSPSNSPDSTNLNLPILSLNPDLSAVAPALTKKEPRTPLFVIRSLTPSLPRRSPLASVTTVSTRDLESAPTDHVDLLRTASSATSTPLTVSRSLRSLTPLHRSPVHSGPAPPRSHGHELGGDLVADDRLHFVSSNTSTPLAMIRSLSPLHRSPMTTVSSVSREDSAEHPHALRVSSASSTPLTVSRSLTPLPGPGRRAPGMSSHNHESAPTDHVDLLRTASSATSTPLTVSRNLTTVQRLRQTEGLLDHGDGLRTNTSTPKPGIRTWTPRAPMSTVTLNAAHNPEGGDTAGPPDQLIVSTPKTVLRGLNPRSGEHVPHSEHISRAHSDTSCSSDEEKDKDKDKLDGVMHFNSISRRLPPSNFRNLTTVSTHSSAAQTPSGADTRTLEKPEQTRSSQYHVAFSPLRRKRSLPQVEQPKESEMKRADQLIVACSPLVPKRKFVISHQQSSHTDASVLQINAGNPAQERLSLNSSPENSPVFQVRPLQIASEASSPIVPVRVLQRAMNEEQSSPVFPIRKLHRESGPEEATGGERAWPWGRPSQPYRRTSSSRASTASPLRRHMLRPRNSDPESSETSLSSVSPASQAGAPHNGEAAPQATGEAGPSVAEVGPSSQ
eukprot:g55977.t1